MCSIIMKFALFSALIASSTAFITTPFTTRIQSKVSVDEGEGKMGDIRWMSVATNVYRILYTTTAL